MRRLAFSILASLALAFAHASTASIVDGVYEADVPVADQGTEAREAALRRALAAVLVKATGRRDIERVEGLASLLDGAQRYLQQFRYRQRETFDPETGEPRMALHLWARFDAASVQRALLNRRIAIWGRERPATLVWLAYDDGRTREVVAPDTRYVFRQVLSETADMRGMQLVEPLMDIEDRTSLPYSELWGVFERSIRDASARYGADAVLVGRLFRVDQERWSARWTLLESGAGQHRETPPGPLAAVVADGVHWIADLYASRFSMLPDATTDGRVRVQVDGIDGFSGYAHVTRFLRDLSMVTAVRLESTHEDRAVFMLDLRGTVGQLEQSIALGSRLAAHQDGHDADWGMPVLRYSLRP